LVIEFGCCLQLFSVGCECGFVVLIGYYWDEQEWLAVSASLTTIVSLIVYSSGG